MDKIHLFEKSGLGQAPYRYLGCEDTGKCSTSCQYCCTGIRYKFYLQSKDGKNFFVGSDCIYKSGDEHLTTIVKAERQRLAKEKREAKKKQTLEERQARREAILKEKIESFCKENQSILHILDWARNSQGIALSLINNLNTWGSLTEKQIELLCKLYHNSQKVSTNCPQGKFTIEGTIQSFKQVDGFYGGTTLKMIVDSIEGYRVFGTVPAKLKNPVEGDCVRFVAEIYPSNSDPTFGFFSRPSKVEQLVCA
jgi:hypothetical protein